MCNCVDNKWNDVLNDTRLQLYMYLYQMMLVICMQSCMHINYTHALSLLLSSSLPPSLSLSLSLTLSLSLFHTHTHTHTQMKTSVNDILGCHVLFDKRFHQTDTRFVKRAELTVGIHAKDHSHEYRCSPHIYTRPEATSVCGLKLLLYEVLRLYSFSSIQVLPAYIYVYIHIYTYIYNVVYICIYIYY